MNEINSKEHDLRTHIIKIRNTLDEIDGKIMSVAYTPCPNFQNKSHYPKDYQIFMEEIGPVAIGSSPIKGEGYVIITMDLPVLLLGFDENESSITVLDIFESGDLCGNTLADNLVIFASDVDADLYGFDQSVFPYKFFASQWTTTLEHTDFISWFVWHINNHLSYVGNKEHYLPKFTIK